MSHHQHREKGNAIVGLALILPLVIYFMFTAYRLGVETAFIPSVQLNMQALLNAQVNSSFVSGSDDPAPSGAPAAAGNGAPMFFVGGITANVQHLIDAAPGAIGINNYSYSLYSSAWAFSCTDSLEPPSVLSTNPQLVASRTRFAPPTDNPTQPSQPDNDIFVKQGEDCSKHFSNSAIKANYCYDPDNILVCYSLKAYMEVVGGKTTDVSHFVFRSIVNDNICPQTGYGYSNPTYINPSTTPSSSTSSSTTTSSTTTSSTTTSSTTTSSTTTSSTTTSSTTTSSTTTSSTTTSTTTTTTSTTTTTLPIDPCAACDPETQTCQGGVCVDNDPCAACDPETQTCQGGVCVDNDPCAACDPETQTCQGGVCVDNDPCAACDPVNEYCDNGVCLETTTTTNPPSVCTTNGDCEPGETCSCSSYEGRERCECVAS